MSLYTLENTIQEYAWGSTTAIPDLLGIPPDPDVPKAELWMGAHPKAPSQIVVNGKKISLLDAIRQNPAGMVGTGAAERFGAGLPFLFKVLAADSSLSIQAHPTLDQARDGFDREEARGIAIDAPHRNYRDRNHKPEIVCALTEFQAMCGFRSADSIREIFSSIGHRLLDRAAERLGDDATGLEHMLVTLLEADDLDQAVEQAITALERSGDRRTETIRILASEHAGDIGALAPLFLNLVDLSPGDALFLRAGILHAYLRGTAVELMANSDNVLRGGLTAKHVDVKELVHTLDFSSFDPDILSCGQTAPGVCEYDTPASEFSLSCIEPATGDVVEIATGMPAIALCVEGSAVLRGKADELTLVPGDSVFVPASEARLSVSGEFRIYLAHLPRRT